MLKLNILVLFMTVCVLCAGADYQKELAAVKSGRINTARAEWWGYNSVDCTKSLQNALNSGVKKLIISKQSGPWLLKKTLLLPSDIEIVFKTGAEIKAAKGCFKRNIDSLMKARDRKNITLRGKGIITMRKADYQNSKLYKPGEHRHTLGFFSCENIKVEGLTLQKSGGDGIYVNKVKNILIDKVTLDDHHRQGISVISAENLLIRDCIIKNTKGTAPECGIDFEPNRPNEKLINCRVVNCRFENNANSAITVNCTRLFSKSEPVDILVENCVFKGGKHGVSFLQMQRKGKESTAKGKILYKNCRIDSPTFSAMHVDTIRSSGLQVEFENLVVSQAQSSVAPIYFYIRKFLNEDYGNLKFINCKFSAPNAKNIVDCVNYSSGALEKVEGNVFFNGTSVNLPKIIKTLGFNQKRPAMTLGKIDAAKLIPAEFSAKLNKKPCKFILRGNIDIALYATKGNKVIVELEYFRLGRYKTPPLELTIIEPGGKKMQLGKLEYKAKQTQEFSFTPKRSGTYILKTPRSRNCVTIKNISVPWAVFCRKKSGLFNLLAPNGAIYFSIPAKVDNFWFEIAGNGGKMVVDATLEVDGIVVAEDKNISRSKYFHINLQSADKPRLAKLSVNARSGFFITLPTPLLPIFSNSPKNIFIEKQER